MSEIEWVLAGSGVSVRVVVDTQADTFTLTVDQGSLDVNALWFAHDLYAPTSPVRLVKSDNSLNMNGTGETWDDYAKLSSTGLGSEGTAKATYLTVDDAPLVLTFADLIAKGMDAALLAFLGENAEAWTDLTVGLRATSVNGTSSVKLVDQGGETLPATGDNTAPTLTGEETQAAYSINLDGFDFDPPYDAIYTSGTPSSFALALADADVGDSVSVQVGSVTAALTGATIDNLPGLLAAALAWLELSTDNTNWLPVLVVEPAMLTDSIDTEIYALFTASASEVRDAVYANSANASSFTPTLELDYTLIYFDDSDPSASGTPLVLSIDIAFDAIELFP
jgi:hypothetical protein